jgi:L-iditol 2-dehydrogenase
MKAARITGVRQISYEEVPDPEVGPEDVLVRVKAAGICGSDIHGFLGLIPERRPPGLIMGHEASGEVVQVARDGGGIGLGDRVVIDPSITCGNCYYCRRGLSNLCDAKINLGSAMLGLRHGAMCEYIAVPSRHVHKLPEEVSFLEGATVEPAGNALHIINQAGLEVGDSVLVVGAGMIGLMATQIALRSGACRVLVADVLADRIAVAKRLGATAVIDSSRQDIAQTVLGLTGGRGVDVAIEAAGFAATYDSCLQSLRKKGRLLALGFSDKQVPFSMKELVYREISIQGCTTMVDFEVGSTIELLARRKLDVRPLVTHEFPLAEAQKAFETASDRQSKSIRVMLFP